MKFEVGRIVNHKVFGEGSVVRVVERTTPYGTEDSPLITVNFNSEEKRFTDYSLEATIL